jgi:hypothetical protein
MDITLSPGGREQHKEQEALMKTLVRISLCCLSLLFLAATLAPTAFGQTQNKPAGKNGDKYARLKYDKTAEVTVTGTVEDIQEFDCPVTATLGSHVVLHTADARILVHVAPVKFMKQYGIELKKGSKITVTGSRLKDGEGGDTMLAREITSDEIVLDVRTPDGKPLW